MIKKWLTAFTVGVMLVTTALPSLHAQSTNDDAIEKAGVAMGVGPGNLWFLPIKAITVTIGALAGALSYVVTGGNAELTQQIWRDTQDEPYVIDQKLARTAVGRRPELEAKK